MAEQWFVFHEGKKHGPFSGAQLKQLAATGKLRAADKVWKEGMHQWVAAEQVKGLLPPTLPAEGISQPPPLRSPQPISVQLKDIEDTFIPPPTISAAFDKTKLGRACEGAVHALARARAGAGFPSLL